LFVKSMSTRSQPPERVVVASASAHERVDGLQGRIESEGCGRWRPRKTCSDNAPPRAIRRRFTMPVTGAMSAGDGATPEGQRTPALAVRERSRQSQDEPAHRD